MRERAQLSSSMRSSSSRSFHFSPKACCQSNNRLIFMRGRYHELPSSGNLSSYIFKLGYWISLFCFWFWFILYFSLWKGIFFIFSPIWRHPLEGSPSEAAWPSGMRSNDVCDSLVEVHIHCQVWSSIPCPLDSLQPSLVFGVSCVQGSQLHPSDRVMVMR